MSRFAIPYTKTMGVGYFWAEYISTRHLASAELRACDCFIYSATAHKLSGGRKTNTHIHYTHSTQHTEIAILFLYMLLN